MTKRRANTATSIGMRTIEMTWAVAQKAIVRWQDPIEVQSNDLRECAVRSIGKCAVRNLTILLGVIIRFGAG